MRFLVVTFLAVAAGVVLATAGNASLTTSASQLTLLAPGHQDADGRMLYLKNCRTCHGATGEPNSENRHKYPKIKALNDPAFMSGISDDSLLAVLKKGAGKDMKSWSDKLSPAEMMAVIKFVRTLPAKKP